MAYGQEKLLGDDFMKTEVLRGLRGNVMMVRYASIANVLTVVGTARQRSAGKMNSRGVQRTIHNHKIGRNCEVLFVIAFAVFKQDMVIVAHPYTFKTDNGIPDSLEDIVVINLYM